MVLGTEGPAPYPAQPPGNRHWVWRPKSHHSDRASTELNSGKARHKPRQTRWLNLAVRGH
ncbi:hypothetical protein P7K49_015185, partial [Saguinus oedipus]